MVRLGHKGAMELAGGRDGVAAVAEVPSLSLPAPGSSWTDWSHVWGGEMRLKRALEKLNLEYPHNSDD